VLSFLFSTCWPVFLNCSRYSEACVTMFIVTQQNEYGVKSSLLRASLPLGSRYIPLR